MPLITHSPICCKAKGFTLIEVLVTIVVMAFGLLGIAGLMLKGLGLNNASYLRSVATQQAYDMGDRIRANIVGATAGNYNAITYTAGQVCATCTNCSAGNLAVYDACYWNKQNETLLPLGRGSVTLNGSSEYVITVSWDTNKDGVVDASDIPFVLRTQQ